MGIPSCSYCSCLKLSYCIIAISVYELLAGFLIIPIFLYLYYIGNIPSEYLGIYGLPNKNLIYTLMISKCILLDIGGIMAIFAVLMESIILTKCYYVWIGFRIAYQIILVFLYQYNALVEIVLWIWLAFEFGHYISYLRRKRIRT